MERTLKTNSKSTDLHIPKRLDGTIDSDKLLKTYPEYTGRQRAIVAKLLVESGREDAIRFIVANVDDTELWEDESYSYRYGESARFGLFRAQISEVNRDVIWRLISEVMRIDPS